MTDDLDRLDKLAEAATPGPWAWHSRQTVDGDSWAVFDGTDHALAVNRDGWAPDAEFIAAANPAVVRALVQRVRDAEAAAKLSHGMLVIEREEHEETSARAERAEAELEEVKSAIERVRAVHRKETRLSGWEVCAHCEVGMLQDPVDWPCDTIAALGAGKETNDE